MSPCVPVQCGTIDYGSYVNLTERNLQDAQKFLLMHEVVQPVVPVPYFMEDNVRFTHVAVDVVQGKDQLFHIIYLATGRWGPGGLIDGWWWMLVCVFALSVDPLSSRVEIDVRVG